MKIYRFEDRLTKCVFEMEGLCIIDAWFALANCGVNMENLYYIGEWTSVD